jgi:hypothetical protein
MITDQPTAAATFQLSHDAWGRLVLISSEGRRHVGVEPVRAFPILDSLHWISICDSDGRELACIYDLAEMPDAARRVLEEDLARREFVPTLEQIYHVSAESAPSEWDVQTDRGRTRFMLNSEDDIRRLGATSVLVIDVNGIRYLINDLRQLDVASRKILDRYL